MIYKTVSLNSAEFKAEEANEPIKPGYAYFRTENDEYRGLTLDGALRLFLRSNPGPERILRAVGNVG